MKNTFKKIVGLVLLACMLVSMSAILGSCGEKFTPAATYTDPDVYKTIVGGSVTTTANGGASAGSVNTLAYAGVTGKDYTDQNVYTYNDYVSATTGLNWNPLSWETNEDSYVLGYITMGFYDFVLNPTLDGYSVVCEMASALPVDVTSQYVGQYGIVEGDTAKAWLIPLNENACWQDGTPITSADYIYSMQQQLDPLALYRRADSYYAGDFQLYNAKAYLYQGKKIWNDAGAEGVTLANLVKGSDGAYTYNGAPVRIALESALDWLSGNTLADYVGAYGAEYFDVTAYESLAALADEEGLVVLNDDSLALITSVITGVAAWGETADDAINYMVYEFEYPVLSWDQVGLFATKTADNKDAIVFVANASVAQPEFYVPYYMSSTWLVNRNLFESCKTYYDKDGNVTTDISKAVSLNNNYCTTLATTIGYGPYKLTSFQADKEIVFERNNNWYGYSDNAHLGQYQTDNIKAVVIDKHETALTTFLAGDIDGIGLQSEDMATYVSSERIRYTPQDYTTKLTFNTNYESLVKLGNNQQLLAVSEFRQAFALSINRQEFATAYTSAGEAGYGLLNYMYCYDPFSGAIYRDSDFAKQALVELFGLTYGEGGDYADLDAAYEAITGYDLDVAKILMQEAYDKAVEAKIYDGKSKVKLQFTVYNSDDIYVKMFNYFDAAIKEACKGTDFEGKVSLTMKEDADYYTTMYSGQAAMIFSTWGGAAMSPFTMINQVYTDAADGSGNQMEFGYETDKINVTIKVNGTDITASLTDWADWCGSATVAALEEKLGLFTDYDYDTRCAFFSIVEKVYLQGYATTSLYYRNSASLASYKTETPTTQYLQLVGTGGIRYTTYNYTDAEWANVKATFNYTSSAAE